MNLANISPDYKWVASFMGYFIMTTHVVCCCWIICARIDPDTENSWIAGYEESSRREIYMTSVYFTVTTITTVGYGDMSASTSLEQVFCMMMMIIGVIAFSMASGALTNFISQQEIKSAAFAEKMKVLERL